MYVTPMIRLFSTLLVLLLMRPPAWAQLPPEGLRIVIVEGEGAINNVRQRINRDPIVQVEDENHKPVAGAVVTFLLPNQGPSGTFLNGQQMLTVTTDAQGRATATGLRTNNLPGQMQIRVTASFAGRTASAVINQTIQAAAAGGAGSSGAGAGLSSTAKILIILGIAGGAAAGGIIAATHGGGGGTTPPVTNPPIVITPGTPTVGAP